MLLSTAIEQYETQGYLHTDCCGLTVDLETERCPDHGTPVVDGHGSLANAIGV